MGNRSASSNLAFFTKKKQFWSLSFFGPVGLVRTRELPRVRARGGNGAGKFLTRVNRAPTLCCRATKCRLLRSGTRPNSRITASSGKSRRYGAKFLPKACRRNAALAVGEYVAFCAVGLVRTRELPRVRTRAAAIPNAPKLACNRILLPNDGGNVCKGGLKVGCVNATKVKLSCIHEEVLKCTPKVRCEGGKLKEVHFIMEKEEGRGKYFYATVKGVCSKKITADFSPKS